MKLTANENDANPTNRTLYLETRTNTDACVHGVFWEREEEIEREVRKWQERKKIKETLKEIYKNCDLICTHANIFTSKKLGFRNIS